MQVFETPGSVSLQIRLPSGRVVVTTVDEPRTSVDVISTGRRGSDAIDAIEISAEPYRDGHLVTIEHKERIRFGPIQISWGGDVEIRVTCPPGSNLDFSSGAADLRVDGDLGEVSVKTASGDVVLGQVAKKLQVKTASGDVTARTASHGGQVVTVSGDLRLDGFERDLAARSVSGDVRIGRIRGPLQLSTTSGDIVLDSVESGEVRAQTVSGDARIGVSRGTRVFIDAASLSGDLSSELGLEDDEPVGESESAEPVVPLQVKTVSGDVQIVRAAESFAS
jgi:Putative adhesin